MAEPGSAELARFEREAQWNRDLVIPKVAPGSHEESVALARIDELRDEELERTEDSFAARRRRQRRYWGRHR